MIETDAGLGRRTLPPRIFNLARVKMQNPFPGPQPFRATDRAHFHGREDLSRRLEGSILAHRSVVVHGPSGSGKSSVIQAAALPNLRDTEDVRVVHLDGWPPGEDPTHWLSVAMHSQLKQGVPPTDVPAPEAVLSSLRRAIRGSSRLLIICIDQLEQLFYSDRDPQKTEIFFDCVNDILDLPLRTLRVVMTLREDYLGVFRDRLRDHRRVLGQGFRVGPLSVAELTTAMCRTAESGSPPQTWSDDEMRTLMMQVRVPGQPESDEAEAQAAYGQIVCRALFQDRAAGKTSTDDVFGAEPILQRYLESTLTGLGALRERADRLLEEHLVSGDGGRTLRTEKELRRHFPEAALQTILSTLEDAAILHAASHQGSRYFEIGHDWLARRVFERRQIREREEEQVREREEERRRYDEKQKLEIEKMRRIQRTVVSVAVVVLILGAGAFIGLLLIWQSKREAEEAKNKADQAASTAKMREIDARDASILAGVRELSSRGKLTWALKLLPEVQIPKIRRGWVALASDLLASNTLISTLEGHTASLTSVSFSPDDKLILTASVDGTARIWDPEGKKTAIVLSGHTDAIRLASWSHDGKSVLTLSLDGTARISSADGQGPSVVLTGDKGPLVYADFSPDDKRVVTASSDGFVRIHSSSGNGALVATENLKTKIHTVRFHPDGQRVFFSTHDERVLSWDGKAKTKPIEIGKHDAAVGVLAMSPKGTHLVSGSIDGTAHIWNIQDKQPRRVATIKHDGPVNHAVFSADGTMVATASSDRMARVLRLDSADPPILLSGHAQGVVHVAFDRRGLFLATASQDATARIFRIHGGVSFVLRGHDAAVQSVAWRSDGFAVATAAGDGTDRSPDETAKVWSTATVDTLGLGSRGPQQFHAATMSTSIVQIVTLHDDGTILFTTRNTLDHPTVVPGSGAWMTSGSMSSNGQHLAIGGFDKQVRLYRTDKLSEPVTLGSHDAEVRFVAMSPDGTRVLSGGDDDRAMIFSIDGKTPPIPLVGHRDWVASGAWSLDNERVVTGSFDHTARVWDAHGRGTPTELVGHQAEILAVAFFSKGDRIVTASADHTARIWTGGKETRILQHDGAVLAVCISPTNELVATYSSDRLIRVWNIQSSDPPIELEAPAAVRILAFDPQMQGLAALDEEGTLRAWVVNVDTLRELTITANADCLPAVIRTLYLNEPVAIAEQRAAACRRNPRELPWLETLDPKILAAASATSPESTAPRIVASPKLDDLGPDAVRVKILVLPTDADVEVDGVLMARHQGVVTFVAKVGQTPKLRAQRGAKYRTYDVTIGKDGASPARFDLNDNQPGSSRPIGTDKPAPTIVNGVPTLDPLLNNDMQ